MKAISYECLSVIVGGEGSETKVEIDLEGVRATQLGALGAAEDRDAEERPKGSLPPATLFLNFAGPNGVQVWF